MRKFLGKKNCTQGAQCKETCISKLKLCQPDVDKTVVKSAAIKIKSAPERLSNSKPKNLEARLNQKRGVKRIQYVSQDEVLRALAVYKKDVLAIKAGNTPHPYINLTKPKEEEVNNLVTKIKGENPALYEKLSGLGIRADATGKSLSTSEKVKIAVAIYLQQDGRSFATGKVVSINKMSLDHLIPLSSGGTNSASNLVLIESNINYLKGAKSLKGFLETLEKKSLLVNSLTDLEKFKEAIISGNNNKIASLQKDLQIKNRIARLTVDRAQASKTLQGAKAKAASLSAYGAVNELGIRAYARYNTPETINSLNVRELKNVTKAQALNGDGVARWYKGPGIKGSQVDYPTGEALKAQLFLNNGGKWRDLPSSWKDAFKEKFLENTNSSGSTKIINAYKNIEYKPEWLN